MKYLLALLAVFLALPVFGQTQFYAAGVSYNQGATPEIAGTALYAHSVDNSGTYAFAVYDALPTSFRPFSVTSNVGAGVAQKIFTVGKVDFYAPTSVGVSFSGSNTGWQWNGGVAASVKIKNSWYAFPTVRFLKSSVSGSGYQFIPTILFGRKQ